MKLSTKRIYETLKIAGFLEASYFSDALDLSKQIRIVTDSRRVSVDDCDTAFLAYEGVAFDAHDKVDLNLLAGIRLLIIENRPKLRQMAESCDVSNLVVKDGRGRDAVALLAAAAYNHPERKLLFWGVTGTNGKTSVSWMLNQLFQKAGEKTLFMGTIGAQMDGEPFHLEHTTPPPERLFELLALALERGVKHVIMEVSSHAVAQKRLGPIRYSGMVFTSFSRDHLDFHESMENYFHCKWALVSEYLCKGACFVISTQVSEQLEDYGVSLCSHALVYGEGDIDPLYAPLDTLSYQIVERQSDSSKINLYRKGKLIAKSLRLPFIADYALDNALGAWRLYQCAFKNKSISPSILSDVRGAPGRLEFVRINDAASPLPGVIVDYAHTPDAVHLVLANLRQYCSGKLWVVLGCGGNRDKGKRSLMGKAAFENADRLVFTSDNPRFEDPKTIIADMLSEIPVLVEATAQKLTLGKVAWVKVDRRAAIALAVKEALPNDIIAILGKGHENYQDIQGKKLNFDDRFEAAHFLAARFQR